MHDLVLPNHDVLPAFGRISVCSQMSALSVMRIFLSRMPAMQTAPLLERIDA